MTNLICRFCGHKTTDLREEMPCEACASDEVFRFIPEGMPSNYDEIKAKHGLTESDIAIAFGISSRTLATTSAKARYRKAVERLYYFFQREKKWK
jgi:hypothetical protein